MTLRDFRFLWDWSWRETGRRFFGRLALVLGLILAALGYLAENGETPRSDPLMPIKLDANSAEAAELEALPGIGPVLAGRIAEARALGPFRSMEDLDLRVRGIGPAIRARIEPFLSFRPVP